MAQVRNGSLWLSSLGGSGENGRNCHLIGWGDGLYLLDCGVRRETIGEEVGGYPALTEELVSRIRAVFLSHCHEDHAAALPLLYRLGYRGAVYASPETIRETPAFIRKWMNYVGEQGGVLPYAEADVEKIRFSPVDIGAQNVEGISVLTGRSGHVCGSLWFCLTIGERRIVYTGDLCMEPVLLASDPIPACDALIADCAYSGRRFGGAEQLDVLRETVRKTAERGGCTLLPVPAKGRGIDLLCVLGAEESIHVCAEKRVEDSLTALKTEQRWVRQTPEALSCTTLSDCGEDPGALLCQGGAFLVTDGMLTTPSAVRWLEAVKSDPANCIVITGHAAKGTPAAELFREPYRNRHGIRAEARRITVKVHPDEGDLCRLAEQSGATSILLFHGDAPLTEQTLLWLENRRIAARTLCYPARMDI